MNNPDYHSLESLQQEGLESLPPHLHLTASEKDRRNEYGRPRTVISHFILLAATLILAIFFLLWIMTGADLKDTNTLENQTTSTSSNIPLYYVTSPEPYPGPTQTAQIAPFLAQTDAASFISATVAVNFPLQTSYPI